MFQLLTVLSKFGLNQLRGGTQGLAVITVKYRIECTSRAHGNIKRSLASRSMWLLISIHRNAH